MTHKGSSATQKRIRAATFCFLSTTNECLVAIRTEFFDTTNLCRFKFLLLFYYFKCEGIEFHQFIHSKAAAAVTH